MIIPPQPFPSGKNRFLSFDVKDLNVSESIFSFVAENWQYGWIGQFMWKVLSDDLGLQGDRIIAMTTLNFTGSTDPHNATSVYKGASAFTRCVWEINLGNVVS